MVRELEFANVLILMSCRNKALCDIGLWEELLCLGGRLRSQSASFLVISNVGRERVRVERGKAAWNGWSRTGGKKRETKGKFMLQSSK